jgi:hypothetical protein
VARDQAERIVAVLDPAGQQRILRLLFPAAGDASGSS